MGCSSQEFEEGDPIFGEPVIRKYEDEVRGEYIKNSLCKIEAGNNIGSGFFMRIDLSKGYGLKKYLCSTEGIITSALIKSEGTLKVTFDGGIYENKTMEIKLTKDRNIEVYEKPIDWVLIELKPIEQDYNIELCHNLRPEPKLAENLELLKLFNGKKVLSFSRGREEMNFHNEKILNVKQFEMINSTEMGQDISSIGFPIININTCKVIGIQKSTTLLNEQNLITGICALFLKDNAKEINDADPFLAKYEGELKNGLYNGNGKLTYPSGVVYTGNFENGKYSGKGKIVRANGDYAEGDFKNGIYNGFISIVYVDGTILEGNCVNGLMNGKGKYKNPETGINYEGDFVNNSFEGYGKLIFKSGDSYEGCFSQGTANGHGKLFDEEGKLIKEGEFKDGHFIQ